MNRNNVIDFMAGVQHEMNQVKTVDLWERVNANAFFKVNAFGRGIHFYFKRQPNVDYVSQVGHVLFHGDDEVILSVNVKEK